MTSRTPAPTLTSFRLWLARFWESVSWGPFYFVRRAVCWLRGHDEQYDNSTPEGGYFCARCMTEDL